MQRYRIGARGDRGLRRLGGLTAAVCLLGSANGQAVPLPFEDGFENVPPGSYPSANGWQMMFSGSSAYVSDAHANTGSQSFRLQSRYGWSRHDFVQMQTIPDRLSYQVSVRVDPWGARQEAAVGFLAARGSMGPSWNKFVIDGRRGTVSFSGAGTLGSYTSGTWCTVRADLDYVSNTADLWLNGQLVAEGVAISPKEFDAGGYGHVVLDQWGLIAGYGYGTGSVVYFDDVWLEAFPSGPPVADAGPDQHIEVAGCHEVPAAVQLDGSGSCSPGGAGLTYTWTGPFPEGGGTMHGVSPTVTLPLGIHTITLVVSDGQVSSEPDTTQVSVGRGVRGPGGIVFASDAGGNRDIWSMSADGENEVQLTDSAWSEEAPAWSPLARLIAFTCGPDAINHPDIWTMNADGTGKTRITTFPGSDYWPTWSPDGRGIAIQSYRDGNNLDVYALDLDGDPDSPDRLTSHPAWDEHPDWSPDGQWIAFQSYRDGGFEIYVIRRDGSGLRNLTSHPANDHSPAWSPDGSQIAFWSNRNGGNEIMVMDADGSNQRRLRDGGVWGEHPTWSPDGQQIAFASSADGDWDIYRVEVHGTSAPVNLTRNSAWDRNPDWGPALPPTNAFVFAEAGEDQRVEQTSAAGTSVTLNGCASCGRPDHELAYTWREGDEVLAGPTTECMAEVTLQLGEHKIELTVEDGAGGVDADTVVVTIEDTTPPALTCPDDVEVECDEDTSPESTGEATATDLCDAESEVTWEDEVAAGDCPSEQTTTRTWTAVDDAGNQAVCVQTITVVDSTPPDLTCPADIDIECDVDSTPQGTGQATATDLCDAEPDVVWEDEVTAGDCPAEQIITRTWTVVDDAGNQAVCVQTITVRDTTPPELTASVDGKPAEADGTVTAEQSFLEGHEFTIEASATDNCEQSPQLTVLVDGVEVADESPEAGFSVSVMLNLGTHDLLIVASDGCDNTTSLTMELVVQDTTAPTVTCPADLEVEQETADGTAVEFAAQATDICDAGVELTYEPESGSAFPLGETTVTVTATDDSGNQGQCSFKVTVVDTTPPALTCPGDIEVEQETADGTVVEFAAQVTDICDADVESTCGPASGSVFPLGETTVTVTATDDSGNGAECQFTVRVVDTTPPAVSSVSADPAVLWPPNHKLVSVTVSTALTDICDADPTYTIIGVACNEPVNGPGDGNTEPDWEITSIHTVKLRAERSGKGDGRVYTIHVEATDASGNTSTGSCTVTVPHDHGSGGGNGGGGSGKAAGKK